MSEVGLGGKIASLFRKKDAGPTPVTSIPEASQLQEAIEKNPGTIIGDVVIGVENPTILTEPEFKTTSGLLFHGAAKEFAYSPQGEFDPNNTGDGSADFGTGFYTTDHKSQAANYSVVRERGNAEKPIVYELLPKTSKMLDVRDKNNPDINGVLPIQFVEEWISYLERYVTDESNFAQYNEFLKKVFRGGIIEEFLEPVKKAVKDNQNVYIRGNYKTPGIFGYDKNGLIDYQFQQFMLSKGYDGMIYREGGEGERAENLTGYVFYNYQALDTYEGWQKRKSQ